MSSLVGTPLYMAKTLPLRSPPLSLSLLTVRFKPKNPHSGLNPKAIGHKGGPLLPHTLTCSGSFLLQLLIFLVHFCFLIVQFRSWRSRRTCHARGCCAVPIGSWWLGLLDVFLFWVFSSLLWLAGVLGIMSMWSFMDPFEGVLGCV